MGDKIARRRELFLFVLDHYFPPGVGEAARARGVPPELLADDKPIADLDRKIDEGARIILGGALGTITRGQG